MIAQETFLKWGFCLERSKFTTDLCERIEKFMERKNRDGRFRSVAKIGQSATVAAAAGAAAESEIVFIIEMQKTRARAGEHTSIFYGSKSPSFYLFTSTLFPIERAHAHRIRLRSFSFVKKSLSEIQMARSTASFLILSHFQSTLS